MVRCQGIPNSSDGFCLIFQWFSNEFWDSLWISYDFLWFFQTDLLSWAESCQFINLALGGGQPVGRANRSQADHKLSGSANGLPDLLTAELSGEIAIAHEWDRATSYPTSVPGVTGSGHLANKFQEGSSCGLLMIIHDRLWYHDIWVTIFWFWPSAIPFWLGVSNEGRNEFARIFWVYRKCNRSHHLTHRSQAQESVFALAVAPGKRIWPTQWEIVRRNWWTKTRWGDWNHTVLPQ